VDERRRTHISKTLSFWLRHNPAAGGLTLDAQGWAEIGAVRAALVRELRGPVSEAELREVVETSEKRRFAIENGKIRANQGHSLALDLDFRPVAPPAALFHGTTRERYAQIRAAGGLAKMQRHHVHLSPDIETALRVARRHRGETPLVLRVDTAAMAAAGHRFFISDNGVYLTEAVPGEFLTVENVGATAR
jgi:putative RNA 2'-phosphotransferase